MAALRSRAKAAGVFVALLGLLAFLSILSSQPLPLSTPVTHPPPEATTQAAPEPHGCVSLVLDMDSSATLVALDPVVVDWLESDAADVPDLLSFAVMQEDMEKLVNKLRLNEALSVTSFHGTDPRYFDPDPLVHQDGVQLKHAHVLVLSQHCAIHIAQILPRGRDPSDKQSTYNWIAPIDVDEVSRGITLRSKAKAFTMQDLKSIIADPAKFGESQPALTTLGDPELFRWQTRFAFVECPTHNAHHYRRAHFNETNERLTRPMKSRLRDGFMRQMARLDRLRLPAFAVAGTLLGWARECDVLSYADIPGNTDVDFGLFSRDSGGPSITQRIAQDAKAQPQLRRALGNFGVETYEVRWSYKFEPALKDGLFKAVAFDLFVMFPNRGDPDTAHYSIIYTGKKRYWGNIHVPVIQLDEICSSELNGSDVKQRSVLIRVPCDPLGFVEAAYGRVWMEPRQKWSYGGGRKVNFHIAGNWTEKQDASMVQTKFS